MKKEKWEMEKDEKRERKEPQMRGRKKLIL